MTTNMDGREVEDRADLEVDVAMLLEGRRVAFLGKLGGMTRREGQALVRRFHGVPVSPSDDRIDLLIVGADVGPLEAESLLTADHRAAARRGTLMILTETQWWEQLGLVELDAAVHRLYTPAMLAKWLDVEVRTIRCWARRGLIVPVREVHRLPYFDFQEVVTARRLAQLLDQGATPTQLQAQLQRLAGIFPGIERPLVQLSIIVDGRDLLMRVGAGLIDQRGQRRFDFDRQATLGETGSGGESTGGHEGSFSEETSHGPPTLPIRHLEDRPASLLPLEEAMALEEAGHLAEAVEAYRVALLADGPSSDIHFSLAELLYRQGDLGAARERYYCAIELDEDFVEARANLGCVLAEQGAWELALAAFAGALERHAEYADAHFQLASTLDRLGRDGEAITHWQSFLHLAPESPWAEEARQRLGLLPAH